MNHAQLGRDFFVQCSIDGLPMVSMVWMKDGQVVQIIPGKVDIFVPQTQTGTQVTSRVEVTATEAKDNGRYTCQGMNAAGVVSMSFEIQAQGMHCLMLYSHIDFSSQMLFLDSMDYVIFNCIIIIYTV